LIGSAASLAGCGGLRSRIANRMHACPAEMLPPSAPPISISDYLVPTSHVSGGIKIAVAATSPSPQRVIFALPGRGGDARSGLEATYIPQYISLYAQKAGRSFAAVGVDGAESYWHARKSGEDRLSALLDDVVPFVRRVLGQSYPRFGIIGFSMGGFGALNAASERPDLFDAVCGNSAAYWKVPSDQQHSVPDAFEGTADFERYSLFNKTKALRHTRVRLVSGAHDPYEAVNQEFARELQKQGIPVSTHWGNGCHDNASSQQTAAEDIAFVLGVKNGS